MHQKCSFGINGSLNSSIDVSTLKFVQDDMYDSLLMRSVQDVNLQSMGIC